MHIDQRQIFAFFFGQNVGSLFNVFACFDLISPGSYRIASYK